MARNRNQHFVPQTYLRGFAESDSVRVYRFVEGPITDARIFDTNIRNVAARRDLYAVVDGDDRDNALDEEVLQTAESRIPSTLEPVIRGRRLTAEDWAALKEMLAIQEARKPGWIDGITSAIEQSHEIARSLYRQHRPEMSEEDVNDALREQWGSTGLRDTAALDAKNLAIKTMTPTIVETVRIYDEFWSCLIMSSAHDFVTSNSPVVYFDPTRAPSGFRGVDRSTIDIEITFPLDRRHALLLARRQLPPYVSAKRAGVSIINSRTVYGSTREVYGYPHLDRIGSRRQWRDLVFPRYGWSLVGLITSDTVPDGFGSVRRMMAARRYTRLLLDAFEVGQR
jgi:hypothetical protein